MAVLARRLWLVVLGTGALAGAVSCGSSSSPTSPDPSPPPPVAPVTLVGAGDIADCTVDGSVKTAALLDTIQGAVMAVGDLAYWDGKAEEFQNCFAPRWGRHKNRIRPVPGNHDYQTPGAAGYYAYFGSAANPPDGYYGFRHGAWLVVALNSNIPTGAGSPQHEWLRQQLAANTTRCVAALIHHPLYTSSENGANPHVRPLWDLLYQAGAELVVSGHDHVYERFAPQDPNGRSDPQRGVRQFVAGTGGAPHYRFLGARPNSEVQLRSWGVLRLTLADGSYGWEFVPVAGEAASDSGSEVCH